MDSRRAKGTENRQERRSRGQNKEGKRKQTKEEGDEAKVRGTVGMHKTEYESLGEKHRIQGAVKARARAKHRVVQREGTGGEIHM